MQNEEDAFLKAIRDNSTDEAARLVYADWLAEHDDPRAEFARLSGEFLRCVRGLADLRRALPTEWLAVMDPLFNRFGVFRLPGLGEGIEGGTVTALHVFEGGYLAQDQPVLAIETDKAAMDLPFGQSGTVVAVLVRVGERVTVGQPLLSYLAMPDANPPAPTPIPQPEASVPQPLVPATPMREYIEALERRREAFRSLSREAIDAVNARHLIATLMVFGRSAVRHAREEAEMNLGWSTHARKLETVMQEHGVTAEQMPQINFDIQLEMLRVLLARHGQPTGFRELPEETTQ
jgi:uncharacterized protein (TIGR02996 family)